MQVRTLLQWAPAQHRELRLRRRLRDLRPCSGGGAKRRSVVVPFKVIEWNMTWSRRENSTKSRKKRKRIKVKKRDLRRENARWYDRARGGKVEHRWDTESNVKVRRNEAREAGWICAVTSNDAPSQLQLLRAQRLDEIDSKLQNILKMEQGHKKLGGMGTTESLSSEYICSFMALLLQSLAECDFIFSYLLFLRGAWFLQADTRRVLAGMVKNKTTALDAARAPNSVGFGFVSNTSLRRYSLKTEDVMNIFIYFYSLHAGRRETPRKKWAERNWRRWARW